MLALVVVWAVTQEWLFAVELGTLLFGLWILGPLEEYPLLPIAVVAEWLAVTIAPMYLTLTGRRILELRGFDPSLVVAVGCAALCTQFVGLRLGFALTSRSDERRSPPKTEPVSMRWLVAVYLIASLAHALLQRAGIQQMRSVVQILLGIDAFRMVVLYMLVVRLLQRRDGSLWVAFVAALEILVLPYGWMAEFLPPLLLIIAGVFFHLRRQRLTLPRWLIIGASTCTVVVVMVMWTGIKPGLRRATRVIGSEVESNRLSQLGMATVAWWERGAWKHDSDALVSRIWALYYPGLAFRRVPASVQHTEGAIIAGALVHIVTPRFLFPDKPTTIDADSNAVRRYAGVWVAGSKEHTSIGFGRFGESFVDFGIAGVLLMELAFGLTLAVALSVLGKRITTPELRRAVGATLALTLCGMQSSWIMTLGPTLLAFMIVGGGSVLFDRYVLTGQPHPRPVST